MCAILTSPERHNFSSCGSEHYTVLFSSSYSQILCSCVTDSVKLKASLCRDRNLLRAHMRGSHCPRAGLDQLLATRRCPEFKLSNIIPM